MKNQLASWGKYSEQIHDYTERGLQLLLETDRGRALQQIVDPYHYREDLKQPKLILLRHQRPLLDARRAQPVLARPGRRTSTFLRAQRRARPFGLSVVSRF